MATDATDSVPTGRFVDGEHRFVLRVYFEDTDLTSMVYHANYLRFLERARSDMLEVAGISQRAAFDAGQGAYAIRDLSIRYLAPARLGDVLTVVSRVTALRAAAVVIHQRVMCAEKLLAEAEVEAVFLTPSGRPRRQPAEWMAVFEPLVWKGN
ncbi:YbgC/FadM family acyl-CoA thioesterase [Stakelama tenebrarum]|uniref:YbgC/FadM family acyl-CoA thioesterase n=1 Tax=Stakelama tenebrarum TaxID=2711215 RepID=A0A6G6Y9K2_9SPHN|nr:YbgC/FadM family acyl-CoA thioesterase [Sphingosinithalassobacter tenebrarum]QIG81388.1 YbgC/FadM family acyl-CoA thioesterase [Sphingosinithalassobacter tenebrarum]